MKKKQYRSNRNKRIILLEKIIIKNNGRTKIIQIYKPRHLRKAFNLLKIKKTKDN